MIGLTLTNSGNEQKIYIRRHSIRPVIVRLFPNNTGLLEIFNGGEMTGENVIVHFSGTHEQVNQKIFEVLGDYPEYHK